MPRQSVLLYNFLLGLIVAVGITTVFVIQSTTALLSVILGATVLRLLTRRFIRPQGFLPPGPIGFPYFGVSPMLGEHPQISITNLAKKQKSNVMSLYLGPQLFVILNDYEAIKAAYIDQAEVFSGRPQNFTMKYMARGNHGITITEGAFWHEQRRFVSASLAEIGAGKSRFEELCLEEAQILISAMLAHGPNNGFNPRYEIDSSIANIICALVWDKRFERRDPVLRQFLEEQTQITGFGDMTNPVQVLPFLRHVPPIRKNWKAFANIIQRLHNMMEHEVAQVEKRYDASVEPTCLTEFYLQRRAKQYGTGPAAEAAAETDQFVNKTNIVITAQVIFTAGTETSVPTLTWCVLFLLLYPDEQQRCYTEILDHVGTDRPVTWNYRTSLPYVDAFLLEVWRRVNIAPLAIVRRNTEDAYVNGYFIPKHTMILPNLWNVHRSEKYWNEPLKFEPKRFLDGGGKVLRPATHIPFSAGKRECPGQGIARMEIFLLLANMIQKLKFIRAPGKDGKVPNEHEFITGAVVQPIKFNCCVRLRTNKTGNVAENEAA